ncbi:MAG: hypothetical protein ABSD63_12010 [Candidatus Korobacteraceae bacterium]|jgi:hypothetical protein
MAVGKWGESFLKSGLPLEHLAVSTFRNMGWHCEPSTEYQRPNREDKVEWFEVDFEAESPWESEGDIDLRFIVECKYHDPSRFWMMLPYTPLRWHFEDRLLNFAPFGVLRARRDSTLLRIAPASTRGVVVSQDGQRQDDALYTAIQQVVHAFVPLVLQHGFAYNLDVKRGYSPIVTAYIPMIITNAALFRLRPSISDLTAIRSAKSPRDVADELPWTWCYFDASRALLEEQWDLIDQHRENESELLQRYPACEERISLLAGRPNWIVVVNIQHLAATVNAIYKQFRQIKTVSTKEFTPKASNRNKKSAAGARVK